MKSIFQSLVFGSLAIGLLACAAHAEENVVVLKKPVTVLEDTSEYHRMNKKILLTAQPIGFAVSPVPSLGINAGYYLGRNSVLQLEHSDGVMNYVFFDIGATTTTLNYKHFFGNSFYLKAGAGYRKIEIKNARLLFVDIKEVGSVENVVAEVAIGNQWQWETFTLGCDWVGLMTPISTISKKYDKGSAKGQDAVDLDNSWNRMANVTSGELLRLYLGASF